MHRLAGDVGMILLRPVGPGTGDIGVERPQQLRQDLAPLRGLEVCGLGRQAGEHVGADLAGAAAVVGEEIRREARSLHGGPVGRERQLRRWHVHMPDIGRLRLAFTQTLGGIFPGVHSAGEAPGAPGRQHDAVVVGRALVEDRRDRAAEVAVGRPPLLLLAVPGQVAEGLVVVVLEGIAALAEQDGAVLGHQRLVAPEAGRVEQLEGAGIGQVELDHHQRFDAALRPPRQPLAQVLWPRPAEVVVQGVDVAHVAAGVMVGPPGRIDAVHDP